MANANFTRDEVILALDVLYSSGQRGLSSNSDDIKELCQILRNLPIHSKENRRADFRNETGVSRQLSLFRSSYMRGTKDPNVGEVFYSVANEFASNKNELHQIADAIRRNERAICNLTCVCVFDESFPEGAILWRLHREVEIRDGKRIQLNNRCSICQLELESLYRACGNLLEKHLIISPCEMDASKRYTAHDFITVCPNCHAALHKYRPWLNKETCDKLLQ